MPAIQKLAKENNLKVIEDSCEAIGAQINVKDIGFKKAGTFGDCAVFAFYPNKQMTTGEGGMIVTDDENIYKSCRRERNQGRGEGASWLQHQSLGYNYRLSDINCALGLAQLQRIDELLKKRTMVANYYRNQLTGIEDIILPVDEPDKLISWFVYVIRLSDKFSRTDRDNILAKLRNEGIGCNNYFTPIHLQPFYREKFGYKEGDFPVTEKISERTIALPFYNNLSEENISCIALTLKTAVSQIKITNNDHVAQKTVSCY
jgi:perosamine synthetase